VLETAGRQWQVERVSAGVRSISNGLTIPAFARRHSDRVRTAVSRCRVRERLTARGATGAGSAQTLISVLRSHGDHEWPRYSPVSGAMTAPCMHAGGVITSSQTTASWVSELRADGAQHWASATAAPCVSLFKPVTVEEPVDLGPSPTDQFDPRALWWRHERLHRATIRDPRRAAFIGERDAVQSRWLAQRPSSAAAFAEADELLERWTAEIGLAPDARPRWVRRYWRQRDRRAGLVPAPDLAGAVTAAS
jgi:secernin